MFSEANTKSNLPAQIELYAYNGNEYHFQFMAKGGGSVSYFFAFRNAARLWRL
jgi:fumarate hydratase class I